MFYTQQPKNQKEKYKEYLKSIASLSRLFSENSDAYIDSRISENLFCKAFTAKNSARDDSTADAFKDNIGIGIKTFIEKSKLQKVAEFNAIRHTYFNKSPQEAIKIIAEARNERLRTTKEIYGLETLVYHCITRLENKINIFESDMIPIDINTIRDIKESKSSIKFEDMHNQYSFNKSKSVLQMVFKLDAPIDTIETLIIDNPVDLLVEFIKNNSFSESASNIIFGENAIYLPLYSTASKDFEPGEKSGLNQWNAAPRTKGGPPRHPDELYIPVPIWIHKKFPDFFIQNKKNTFELELPNGDKLNAKLCQANLKGLMSNPNKSLGKWLLRDVIKLPERTLATRDLLDKLNIDSVLVEKISDKHYKIDFDSVGKYEEFKDQFES